jgi:aspartyl-tRNA(Asn)/glutamyl-tRNA(Gln) amidotransferase subunit C
MVGPNCGISREDIRRIAELASLGLTDEEESRMQRDLNVILDYVAQLSEVDTGAVEPMTQVELVIEDRSLLTSRDALRPDVIQPSLDRAVVMAQEPETDGRFFRVPKVIER